MCQVSWGRGPAPLADAGKLFHGFGEIGYGLVGITMFDAFFDTVVKVAFQNHLPDFMQSAFNSVDLNQNILTGDLFFNHFPYASYLAFNFFQPGFSFWYIYALSHYSHLKL